MADWGFRYKWDVPIWLKRGVNPISEFHWLPANGQLIVPYGEETIVLNDGSFAYARTNYTYEGWRRIIDQLKKNHTVIFFRENGNSFRYSRKEQDIVSLMIYLKKQSWVKVTGHWQLKPLAT